MKETFARAAYSTLRRARDDRVSCIWYTIHRPTNVEEIKALTNDVIDSFVQELDERLSDKNNNLWTSFRTLLPTSDADNFLNINKLKVKPLLEYCLSIPHFSYLTDELGNVKSVFKRLENEWSIFKSMLLKKFGVRKKYFTLKDDYIMSEMLRF